MISDREDCTPCQENLGDLVINLLEQVKNAYCDPANGSKNVCLNGSMDDLIIILNDALKIPEGQTVVDDTCNALYGVCALTFEDATCANDINTILANNGNDKTLIAKIQEAVALAESVANLDDGEKTAVNEAYNHFDNLLRNNDVAAETFCEAFKLL